MWNILIKLVVTAGMAFFKEWRARKDVEDNVRLEMAVGAAKKAVEAYKWKAEATASGTGTDLRVQPGGGKIELPGDDSDTPGGAS